MRQKRFTSDQLFIAAWLSASILYVVLKILVLAGLLATIDYIIK